MASSLRAQWSIRWTWAQTMPAPFPVWPIYSARWLVSWRRMSLASWPQMYDMHNQHTCCRILFMFCIFCRLFYMFVAVNAARMAYHLSDHCRCAYHADRHILVHGHRQSAAMELSPEKLTGQSNDEGTATERHHRNNSIWTLLKWRSEVYTEYIGCLPNDAFSSRVWLWCVFVMCSVPGVSAWRLDNCNAWSGSTFIFSYDAVIFSTQAFAFVDPSSWAPGSYCDGAGTIETWNHQMP